MDARAAIALTGKSVVHVKIAPDGSPETLARIVRIIGATTDGILVRRTDDGPGFTVLPEDLHLPEHVALACNMCGFPVIILQTGAAVHASAADGMFCEMMYPN